MNQKLKSVKDIIISQGLNKADILELLGDLLIESSKISSNVKIRRKLYYEPDSTTKQHALPRVRSVSRRYPKRKTNVLESSN